MSNVDFGIYFTLLTLILRHNPIADCNFKANYRKNSNVEKMANKSRIQEQHYVKAPPITCSRRQFQILLSFQK